MVRDHLPAREPESLEAALTRISQGFSRFEENRPLQELIRPEIEGNASASRIHDMLAGYASNPANPPRNRIRARLAQQQLQPYLAQPVVPAGGISAQYGDGIEPRAARQGCRVCGFGALLDREEALLKTVGESLIELARLKRAWLGIASGPTRPLASVASPLDPEALEEKPVVTAAPDGVGRDISPDKRRTPALAQLDFFLRQVEEEVGRVSRHGGALTLAVLCMPDLATLIEEGGNEAQDAALASCTSEILNNIRLYDLVARLDDGAFAIMFPHTEVKGARRAVDKIQQRAASSHFRIGGKRHVLPPVTAAVVPCDNRGDPAALLARASRALERARTNGESLVLAA